MCGAGASCGCVGDGDSRGTFAPCCSEVGGGAGEVLEAGGRAKCVGAITIDLYGKQGWLGKEMSEVLDRGGLGWRHAGVA